MVEMYMLWIVGGTVMVQMYMLRNVDGTIMVHMYMLWNVGGTVIMVHMHMLWNVGGAVMLHSTCCGMGGTVVVVACMTFAFRCPHFLEFLKLPSFRGLFVGIFLNKIVVHSKHIFYYLFKNTVTEI
jgi:hypothetical protein